MALPIPTGAPLFAKIDTSTDGGTLVAAVSGRRIAVLNYAVVADSAVTVTFKSNTTALTGAMSTAANGGVSASGTKDAWLFETASGEALKIGLGGAVGARGHLAYIVY
jgi:hypothetical protein